MSVIDGDTPVVDEVNTVTDDLDTFSQEFFGGSNAAAPVEDEPEIEDETPVEDDEPEGESEPGGEDDDPEEDPDPEPEQKPRNRKTAKERINELVQERREAETRAKEAERRLVEFEARLAKIETPKTPEPEAKASTDTNGPDKDELNEKGELLYPLGEFDPNYIADLTRYHFRKANEEAKAEAAKTAQEKAIEDRRNTLAQTWEEKLVETEEEIPELRQTISTLDGEFRDLDPAFGAYLVETIMQLDRGPEVLFYLASNPAEAHKIVNSGHVGATIDLGRLEGQLTSTTPKAESPRSVSKAPPPPSTTRGNSVSTKTRPDTDDLEAFEKEFFKRR